MNDEKVLNDAILHGFVNPTLCKKLMQAGITCSTIYKWKITNDKGFLYTYAFDMDGYYEEGDKNIESINPPDVIIPAYQLKDIEKTIPIPYLLTRSANGEYELMCDAIYQMRSIKAFRMPDVFALMLLDALCDRKLDLDKTNLLIANKTN